MYIRRLNITCSDGYQWIIHGPTAFAVPTINDVAYCQGVLGTTCSDAFRGALLLLVQFIPDTTSGYWAQTLFPYFTQQDPYEVFSHQKAMTAPLLGDGSMTHDAVLAIFIGAISLIKNNMTINGNNLVTAIREV